MRKNIKVAINSPLTWKHYICSFIMVLGFILITVALIPFALILGVWTEYQKTRKEHKEQFKGVKHYFALMEEERCRRESKERSEPIAKEKAKP